MLPGYVPFHLKDMDPTSAFPFYAYSRRISGTDSYVPLHWHEEMEFIFFREGEGCVNVDLEQYPVKAGSIILICPNQLHSIESDEGTALSYDSILFPLTLLSGGEDDFCDRDYFRPLSEGKIAIPVLLTDETPWYHTFITAMEDTASLKRYYAAGYPLAIKSRLFQLFYILIFNEGEPRPRTRPRKSTEKARMILEYLTAHCTEHLTVEMMAEVSGLSESHFMKFFKSTAGLPFIEYLNEYRLNMAGLLLETTQEPVIDVALRCGYENVSYFNRLFKRHFGITPSRYRRSME